MKANPKKNSNIFRNDVQRKKKYQVGERMFSFSFLCSGWMKVSNPKLLFATKLLALCGSFLPRGSGLLLPVVYSIRCLELNPCSSPKKSEERIPSSSSVPVVLSVDDDSIHQQIIASVLRPCGYEVPPFSGKIEDGWSMKWPCWLLSDTTSGITAALVD